jgi:hypothetical protein
MSGDKVGYGRPPVHSRFKKGNSGNPQANRVTAAVSPSRHNAKKRSGERCRLTVFPFQPGLNRGMPASTRMKLSAIRPRLLPPITPLCSPPKVPK